MSDRANTEFVTIVAWYMNQQEGLDTKFINQFEIDLNAISNQPLSFPQFKKGFREALMNTFPYFIIYLVDKKAGIVSIISIFHTSRNPTKKFSQ